MKIFFWVVAVCFGGGLFLVGAGDFTRNLRANLIASVDGTKLTRASYLQRLRLASEKKAETGSDESDMGESQDEDLRKQVFRDALKEALLRSRARELGMEAGFDQVKAALQSERAFRDAQGHFSPMIYQELLARQNMTAEAFETQVAESMTLNRLTQTFSDLSPFTELELKAEWARRHRRVKAGWVLVSREDYLEKVGIPEPDLREYFKLHSDELGTAPEAQVRHILSALPQDAKEADVAAAKKSLEALKVRIEKKEITFEQAAKELSMDPQTGAQGGSMGWLKKNETLPDFAPLFDLEPHKVSAPIRTRYGFHLFLVEALKGGKKADYAGSRKAILDKMAGPEADQMARDAAQRLSLQARGAAGLRKAALDQKLAYREASFVLAEGPAGFKPAEAFLDACGDQRLGELSKTLPIPAGYLIAVVLEQTYTQPKPENLAKDASALVAALRQGKGGAVVDAVADGLLTDAEGRGAVKTYAKPGEF